MRNLDEFHEVFGTAEGDGLWLDPERARPDLVIGPVGLAPVGPNRAIAGR